MIVDYPLVPNLGTSILGDVRIIARGTLKRFWEECGDSEQPLKAWFQETKRAQWSNPNEIKAKYPSASILRNSRVVFNIGGGKYRLVVRLNYKYYIVFIRFIGTHKKYDKINAEDI